MIKNLLLCAYLFVAANSYTQSYNFNSYTASNGLSQDFVYTINQDDNGYLWIGTGDGLNSFDGINFESHGKQSAEYNNFTTCSYKTSNGDIWFGHNNGELSCLHENKIELVIKENEIQSPVNAIDSYENTVFFVTQNDGLFSYENEKINSIGKFNQELFYTLKVIDNTHLLLGTNEGLFLIINQNGTWNTVQQSDTYPEISTLVKIDKNNFLVGTNNGDILNLNIQNNAFNLSTLNDKIKFETPIKKLLLDSKNNLWLATGGIGVLKIKNYSSNQPSFNYYNQKNGLTNDYIQTIFEDFEGNIWIGTFGSGILSLTEDYFMFYSNLKHNYIKTIYSYNNTKWLGTDKGIIALLPNDSTLVFDASTTFIDDEITALQVFDSILWIGTYSNGIYNYNLSTQKFTKINWDLGVMQNRINDFIVEENRVWVATDGGLIIYSISQNRTNIFTTEDGLDHNAIESIYKTKDGRILMGTYSRHLFVLENSAINSIEIVQSGELEILDFDESTNGDIWFATAKQGVYRLANDSIYSYTTYNGLNSNYSYAVKEDNNGNIWVGHRDGMSKINPKQDKIVIYNQKDGISSQVNKGALYLDSDSYLWIGTEEGLIRFDGQKDLTPTTPPKVNISTLLINDKNYDYSSLINLKYGTYRLDIEFIGIFLSNPDDIFYQFKLEGFDDDFSMPNKSNTVTYSKLPYGDYTFKVKAFTSKDELISDVVSFQINIAKPFWLKWWFYLICIIIIAAGVHFFYRFKIKRIEHSKQIIQEQLDIKTKEVRESAKKIETINFNLTGSINYALTLQQSILSTAQNMEEKFPNSFIYFKPRDIVSGDFYFITNHGNKSIFACVDCTGHGVPGAFLSMIGYVALRDIYRTYEVIKQWETPEKVLEQLDHEIINLLGGNTEENLTFNGMDMVLCEYNNDTKELLVSSAKRPIVLKHEGDIKTIKGDKRSIGEKDYGLNISFSLHSFIMSPNDCIYMYSDGFTDQFGGPNSKKIGSKRIVNILKEAILLPNSKQEELIVNAFEAWQGEKTQTDDIIFMTVYF